MIAGIQIGDIIEIGPHRLMCGDATNPDHAAKLMQGELADLATNDPPYGMKKEKDGVMNDNMNQDRMLEFNRQWIGVQLQHLKGNGSFYCWGTDESLIDIYAFIFRPMVKEGKMTFRQLVTWSKADGKGMNSDLHNMYATTDEKCLFLMNGGVHSDVSQSASYFYEGFEPFRQYYITETKKAGLTMNQIVAITGSTTTSRHCYSRSQYTFPTKESHERIQKYCLENGIEAFTVPYSEFRDRYEAHRVYFNNTHDVMNSVWTFPRTSQQERKHTGGHPTPKPLAVCRRIIKSSCPPGGTVLDSFLGSGSTMVAAQQTGRKCRGLELSPDFCRVIVDRMLHYFPNLHVSLNGEPLKDGSKEMGHENKSKQMMLF